MTKNSSSQDAGTPSRPVEDTNQPNQTLDEMLRDFRGWVALAGNDGKPYYELDEFDQSDLDTIKAQLIQWRDTALKTVLEDYIKKGWDICENTGFDEMHSDVGQLVQMMEEHVERIKDLSHD